MKRQLEDQVVEVTQPKSKRFKIELQQEDIEISPSQSKICKLKLQQKLIRKIIASPEAWATKIENTEVRHPLPVKKLLKIEDHRIKEISPKTKMHSESRNLNKPTACMKCDSTFFACSFTLSESKDLQECCLQTIRGYLLQRRLCIVRNPCYV